jgi:hypothetical protein
VHDVLTVTSPVARGPERHRHGKEVRGIQKSPVDRRGARSGELGGVSAIKLASKEVRLCKVTEDN